MQLDALSHGGEFFVPAREAEYRAAHMPEYMRHLRWTFGCAFAINVLFYLNDWHFFGQPPFLTAISARTVIVVTSALCYLATRKARTILGLQRVCAGWIVLVVPACATLVLPHTESALTITLILPVMFYLLFPLPFYWTLVLGGLGSYTVLGAYMFPEPLTEASLGLVLEMLTINAILVLLLTKSNRLRRLEWSATQALRSANGELSEHREILRSVLAAVPAPLIIMVGNADGPVQANEAARRYFGEEALANPKAIRQYFDPRDLVRASSLLQSDGRLAGFETRLTLTGGETREVLLEVAKTAIGGRDALLAVIVDITERKEMEANLERLASTDPLTGLANRTRFFAMAKSEIRRARRYSGALAIVMIDIDFFKRINDSYGHETGDHVLKAFADTCRALVRDQDVVARLGGEEFGLLLPETDRCSAMALADRLRQRVSGLEVGGMKEGITISAGVSEVLPGEDTVDAALSRADQALYTAKRSGRDRVMLFDLSGRKVSS